MVAAVDLGVSNACSLHVVGLARGFARLGHQVALVVPRPSVDLPWGDEMGGRVDLRFAPFARRLGLPNTLGFLSAMPVVWRILRGTRGNLIYVRMGPASAVLLLAVRARFGRRCRILSEHNGWLPEEIRLLGRWRWAAGIAGVMQTLDARVANRVRAVTDGMRTKLIAHGVPARKVFVVGNGTDPDRFRPVPRGEALSALDLDPRYLYLGFIGTLAKWQGVRHAIDALHLLNARLPGARLLVAGDGPEREALESRAGELGMTDRVHFLGHIPAIRSNLVINCFHLALAPFIKERNAELGVSPLKIRDYAAAGRPVLAADLPGIRELASGGWLVTHHPEDPRDLADKAEMMFVDPGLRERMGATARAYAEKYFGWGEIARQILEKV